MGVVICPACGRFNFPEELAARGFTCDLCRGSIPVPEVCPKNEAITSEPLLCNSAVVPERPLPGRGGYPVSKVCPNCEHAKFPRLHMGSGLQGLQHALYAADAGLGRHRVPRSRVDVSLPGRRHPCPPGPGVRFERNRGPRLSRYCRHRPGLA